MSGAPCWHVSAREGSAVLLCGSIPSTNVPSERVEAGIEAALTTNCLVWCEFPPTEELAASPLLAELGLSSGALSSRLDEPLGHRLDGACEQLGIERPVLESMRPWLVAQIVDGAHGSRCAVDPSLSADTVIARLAAARGVSVRYEYPSPAAAFALFAGMTPDVELDYLRWTLDRSLHPPGACMRAADEWAHGSLTALGDETNAFARSYPELFEVLVGARNRAWVRRIDEMIHADQQAIVIVGAGHLVGPAAIPRLLDEHDLTVRRIDR